MKSYGWGTLFCLCLCSLLFLSLVGCGGDSATTTTTTTSPSVHWQDDPTHFATGYFLCTEGNENYYRERYGVDGFDCNYLYYANKQAGEFYKVYDGPLLEYTEDGTRLFALTADHALLCINSKADATQVYRAGHGALHLLKLKDGIVHVVDGDRLMRFDEASQSMTQVVQCEDVVYYYLKNNGDVVWQNSTQSVYVYSPKTDTHTPVESVAVAIADETE